MKNTLTCTALIYWALSAPLAAAQVPTKAENHTSCSGIVTEMPARMYDFKMGKWDINWRNKSGLSTFSEFTAVSTVFSKMDGDILIDDQIAETFKGITFRTYDAAKKEWVVRWLPAGSTFAPNISAKLENCVPVERHEQLARGGIMAKVRTSFTNITADRFEFHQDWSLDEGETWTTDVLYYEALRQKD
ncbi:MAG: hypothetical protein JKY60_08345 [Kordiimonadaceae bacterium]|nr:hypothetical protein [Kordiimonadaceae bacterium]